RPALRYNGRCCGNNATVFRSSRWPEHSAVLTMNEGTAETMASRGLTGSLAHRSARHPWITLVAWVVVLGIGIMLASGLNDVLTTDADFTNNPEAVRGQDLVEERLRENEPLNELLLVSSDTLTVDDPEF